MPLRVGRGTGLETGKQALILIVRSDPEPDDCVCVTDTNCTVLKVDACRVDRTCGMNLAKPQTRMCRILAEKLVRLTSLPTDHFRQCLVSSPKALSGMRNHKVSGSSACVRPTRNSANASSANWSRASDDVARSCDHRRSDLSSSRSHAASASCSCIGSVAASAKACSNNVGIRPSFIALSIVTALQIILYHLWLSRTRNVSTVCGMFLWSWYNTMKLPTSKAVISECLCDLRSTLSIAE